MKKSSEVKNNAGKGDSPRNCFSKKFKDNYEQINWHRKPSSKNGGYTKKYFYK